jgi:hypothetical protein
MIVVDVFEKNVETIDLSNGMKLKISYGKEVDDKFIVMYVLRAPSQQILLYDNSNNLISKTVIDNPFKTEKEVYDYTQLDLNKR